MAGLHLYTGNRLETLKDRLADRLKHQPLPPFQPELIVVQSEGMQKWLSLQLAAAHGISANVAYRFPKTLVQEIFENGLTAGGMSFFSPESLTWSVMKTLPRCLEDRIFESLRQYLQDDPSGLNLFQLSQQIAEMLGRYFLLRPDVILAWGRGENPVADEPAAGWQAALWRRILAVAPADVRGMDPATLKNRLIRSSTDLPGLPERISVFGISTLAPYYIDILIRLAVQIDLDVYYMNPCRQFWEYVLSEKEMTRFIAEGMPEEAAYMEAGNPLLAAMGTAGREFFSLLLSRVGDGGHDLFMDPGATDMLTRLQSDVLDLVDIRGDALHPAHPDDGSIQVHACHSPLREMEVLYDNLLAVFDKHADVQPQDVVVMMPDVSAYAPLIRAVFDTPERPDKRIAYSIADATVGQVNTVAGALLTIFSLDRNRYRASEVLDLLENPAVRNRFGLGEQDLDRVREWVSAAGIRWGIDGRYRAGLGLPDFDENTWSFGLDRMLLGHALAPVSGDEMFAGILPYGRFEGDNSRILGEIAGFADILFKRCRSLKTERTLPEWTAALNGILSDFFLADDEAGEDDIVEIRRMILEQGLAEIYERTGFNEPVSLDVIRHYLESRLTGTPRWSGFISNGVTFCTLLPMRSIPFKVVCMLGMNDGDFPRTSRRPRFDLLESRRRPCDFSKTFEDRYLFLESLLSARKSLIISYIGQDIRDNSPLPPASVVCELLEYLDGRFIADNGGSMAERVVTRHPLQPFSSRYFQNDGKLFSYSEENYQAALKNEVSTKAPRPLFDRPLPAPAADEWQPLGLDQLTVFFKNPTAFIMRQRLSLNLTMADQVPVDDREPFLPDSLEDYLLRQDMVDILVNREGDEKKAFDVVRAAGRLPHGSLGEIVWARNEKAVREFLKAVRPFLEGGLIAPETIECRLDDSRQRLVEGVLDSLYPGGQLFYRCAGIKATDILRAWIYHLALNAAGRTDIRTTRLIGSDRLLEFPAMAAETARAHLSELTGLFFQGLAEPLGFFPESSLAMAEKTAAGKSRAESRGAAARKWLPDGHRPGEGEEIHVSRCFDESVLDDERFYRIARMVYDPILPFI